MLLEVIIIGCVRAYFYPKYQLRLSLFPAAFSSMRDFTIASMILQAIKKRADDSCDVTLAFKTAQAEIVAQEEK